MQYFLVNKLASPSVPAETVGPFDSVDLAEAYKNDMLYGDEFVVTPTITPDFSRIAEALLLAYLKTLAALAVVVDGNRVVVSFPKLTTIKYLRQNIPAFGLREAKDLVDRVFVTIDTLGGWELYIQDTHSAARRLDRCKAWSDGEACMGVQASEWSTGWTRNACNRADRHDKGEGREFQTLSYWERPDPLIASDAALDSLRRKLSGQDDQGFQETDRSFCGMNDRLMDGDTAL